MRSAAQRVLHLGDRAVEARSADVVNPALATGEIEVAASGPEMLNPSAPLPFQLDERTTVNEDAWLKTA